MDKDNIRRRGIAVIGDHDLVMGFRAVGADTFAVNSVEDGISALEDLYAERGESYALVLVSEDIAAHSPDTIEAIKAKYVYPILTVIPSKTGPKGDGEGYMRRMIEKAIGFNILGEE